MNCPVCQKAGIQDYAIEAVVCSQCNSDLKAFMLLKRLDEEVEPPKDPIPEPSRSNTWRWITISLAIILVFLIGLFLWLRNNYFNENKSLQKQIGSLKGSLDSLKNQRLIVVNPDDKPKEEKYIVQKGDYLYKIANQFYKDGRQYKRIADDNRLADPDRITAGDTLNIKF